MQNQTARRFLNPNVLAKIANLELVAKFVVEGFISGLHKSPYHGFSVEFAQYRPYMPGDEPRYIDWKAFARTNRLYVKQFEEETNLNCYLILDTSGSMGYKSGELSKLEYGSYLTASLAYFMNKQRDSVGFVYFDDEVRAFFPAKSSTAHLHAILIELENIRLGERTLISEPLHRVAERLKKRGLVVLISDLYDESEAIMNALAHFRYDGHEVIIFHLLDHQEMHFEFERLTRFVDMETDEQILTVPQAIREKYTAEVQRFIQHYRLECDKEAIDYNVIDTSTPLDFALLGYLAKREGLM